MTVTKKQIVFRNAVERLLIKNICRIDVENSHATVYETFGNCIMTFNEFLTRGKFDD